MAGYRVERMLKAGQFEEAGVMAKEILLQDPDRNDMHVFLGEALAGEGKHEDALFYFMKAIPSLHINIQTRRRAIENIGNRVEEWQGYKESAEQLIIWLDERLFDEVKPDIIRTLGKLGVIEAEETIKKYVFHVDEKVRRSVHAALIDLTGQDYIY